MTTKLTPYQSDRPAVKVLYFDGKLSDMSEVVDSISIAGDVAKASRSCAINFSNTTKGVTRIFDIVNGKEIRILVGNDEVFRGIIFSFTRESNGRDSLVAHDSNEYLPKNSMNVKYVGATASGILTDICGKLGVPIGKIDNTGYSIPRYIMRQKSAYDIIVTALTLTRKATGKRYMLGNDKGKVTLREVVPAKEWLRYEAGKNLIDATFTESIEDVKTKVEYTGGDELSGYGTTASSGTSKYGVMQHTEHNGDATAAALPGLAAALVNELSKPTQESSIKVLGVPGAISGSALIVKDMLSGIQGTYFIMADNHEFSAGGVHTMDLTLSKTLNLPMMDYEPPDESKPSSNSSSGGSGSSPGSGGGSGSSASVGGLAGSIVSTANSYKGKLRYVFGGKNLESGGADCSGFTHAVFKKHGINIPHGTSNQIKKGRAVNAAEAQPGDLVFFKDTYRKGVSHVGIVTRKGYCVSLHNSGATEHSYTTGYWGNHYMSVRRVL